MPKGFDPDKARTAAQATIDAAVKRRDKANDNLEPFKARVAKAQAALAKATAKVDEENQVIARQQAYLDATATLNEPVPADAEVGDDSTAAPEPAVV